MSIILINADTTIEIQSYGSVQQSSCINLKQLCGNCTSVNITSIVYRSNASTLLSSVAMTNSGTEYNYTFCNTATLGEYIVNGNYIESGETKTWVYNFTVTPTGDDRDNTLPLFILLSAGAILVVALFIKNEYLGFISGVLFLIGGIYVLINGLGNLSDLYTQSVGLVTLGVGMFLIVISGLEALNYLDLGEHEFFD